MAVIAARLGVIVDSLRLSHSGTFVQLVRGPDGDLLRLFRSGGEPDEQLIALTGGSLLGARARFCPRGRWGADYWTLAWGCGTDAAPPVRFSTSSLRHRLSTVVEPLVLGGRCWLAEAAGLYDAVSRECPGAEPVQLAVAPARRC